MASIPAESASAAATLPLWLWLADLLSTQQAYATWIALEQAHRSAWLEEEGYDTQALWQGLLQYQADATADPSLAAALHDLLQQGTAIPDALLIPLAQLLNQRLQVQQALAAGSGPGVSSSRGLFGNLHTAIGTVTVARKLQKQAAATQLGLYVETLGGLQAEVAQHVTNQVDADVAKATGLLTSKVSQARSLETKIKADYITTKEHFIRTKENEALTAEEAWIAQAKGSHPLNQRKGQGNPLASLGPKERALLTIDQQYYQQHDKAELQKDLIITAKPSHSGSGASSSWTLSFDWEGSRESVNLDRHTAAVELNPALIAVNRFTAHALWNARLNEQLALLPSWESQVAKAHPKAETLTQRIYPNAKLPTTIKQLKLDKRSVIQTAEARKRKAERHGVTLFSLQRRSDEKRLLQNPRLQQLAGPAGSLLAAGKTLNHTLRTDLKHLAVQVLISDLKEQLAASDKAQAFLSNHASRITSLRNDLNGASITIDVSGKRRDYSWSSGTGLSISRVPKGANGFSASFDAEKGNQYSVNLGLKVDAGTVSDAYTISREGGAIIRQSGNAYTVSSRWQHLASTATEAMAGYKRSLRKAAAASARSSAQQHPGLSRHTKLVKLYRKVGNNVGTIASIFHDISVDRRIETSLTKSYGSLRAQKVMLDQARKEFAAAHGDAVSMVTRLHDLSKSQLLCLQLEYKIAKGEWIHGVKTDKADIAIAKKVYQTRPYTIQKNSSGKGYHLEPTNYAKDYWQKRSQYNRYDIYNPIYNSEKYFYASERGAFIAGAGAYRGLRRAGATKRMARLGATAVYFTTLLEIDKRDLKDGWQSSRIAYAPFILRRQLRVAKQAIYLNRHHSAWRLRLLWKVRREQFLYKKMSAYEHYMLNNKFTGFHPWHRIGRTIKNTVTFSWRHTLGPALKISSRLVDDVLRVYAGPAAAKWWSTTARKVSKTVTYLVWHAAKAFWNLPEHLYHHTIYFGKQLLFAITHPWAYRKIWRGLKKDFKGFYKLVRFVWRLTIWSYSVWARLIYQSGRWITRQGANWKSIFKGAYSKDLHHFEFLIGHAYKFSGLAALVGKAMSTKTALKIAMVRHHVRHELHRLGFFPAPWRQFLRRHKTFATTAIDVLEASPAGEFLKQLKATQAYIQAHWKHLLADYTKMKLNKTYRLAVDQQLKANYATVQAKLSYKFTALKPTIKAYLHSAEMDVLDRVSQIKNKSHKVKIWTLRQYGLDFSEILRARRAYNNLGKRGKKQLPVAISLLKWLNESSQHGWIKSTLTFVNMDIKVKRKTWKSMKSEYSAAVNYDWSHMGQYVGGDLLAALQNSFKNPTAKKQATKLIVSDYHVGKNVFEDIMGGFYLHHYLQLVHQKDAGLLAEIGGARSVAGDKFRAINAILAEPVVNKIAKHWVSRNRNSLLVKDYIKVCTFGHYADKQVKKWERVEKIGTMRISANDLSSLYYQKKNNALAASLGSLIADTGAWKQLSLAQQQVYRSQYEAWVAYNQTTNHQLDKAISKFESNDKNEANAWKAERNDIESGDSLSVGSLLIAVQESDQAHANWRATPKPPLDHASQHLQKAASSIVAIAQNPSLISVSYAAHVARAASGATPVKPNPSGFAYIMQVRHWYKKYGKWKLKYQQWKADSQAKAKAKQDAAKAKEDLGKAKQDKARLSEQAKTAKQQLKSGEVDQQQLIAEAERTDGAAVEQAASDQNLDKLARLAFGDQADTARVLLSEEEQGQIQISGSEFERAEVQERERLMREDRHAISEHKDLKELQGGLKLEEEAQAGGGVEQALTQEADRVLQQDVEPLVEQGARDLVDGAVNQVDQGVIRIISSDSTEAVAQIEGELRTVERVEVQTEEDLARLAKDSMEI